MCNQENVHPFFPCSSSKNPETVGVTESAVLRVTWITILFWWWGQSFQPWQAGPGSYPTCIPNVVGQTDSVRVWAGPRPPSLASRVSSYFQIITNLTGKEPHLSVVLIRNSPTMSEFERLICIRVIFISLLWMFRSGHFLIFLPGFWSFYPQSLRVLSILGILHLCLRHTWQIFFFHFVSCLWTMFKIFSCRNFQFFCHQNDPSWVAFSFWATATVFVYTAAEEESAVFPLVLTRLHLPRCLAIPCPFGVTFGYGVKYLSNFLSLHMATHSYQRHLLKSPSSPPRFAMPHRFYTKHLQVWLPLFWAVHPPALLSSSINLPAPRA